MILSLALGEGVEFVYVPEIGYPLVDTELTVRIHWTDHPQLTYAYRHETRSEFDNDVTIILERDGSILKSQFDCAPSFPAAENDGCDKHLGGFSNANGAAGGLFGLTLLAGLDHRLGQVERSFLLGTQAFTGKFDVHKVQHGIVEISAANDQTRGLPYPIAELADPIANCSVFTGRVRLDVQNGVPLSCLVSDSDGDYGWRLASTTAHETPTYRVDVPNLGPRGGAVRRPSYSDDAELPFGLEEALNEASSREAAIAEFLTRDPYLAESVMGFSGSQSTGDCNRLCLKSQKWHWILHLEAEETRLSFRIEKTIDEPGNLEGFAVSDVKVQPAPFAVSGFPASIVSLGTLWKQSSEAFGFQPRGLHYFASLAGPDNSVLEPFIRLTFGGPEGEVVSPFVVYRADGLVALWQAHGAQPTPV